MMRGVLTPEYYDGKNWWYFTPLGEVNYNDGPFKTRKEALRAAAVDERRNKKKYKRLLKERGW